MISVLLLLCRRQEKTIMKLVVDAETDKVLGASMCGPDAPEIMQVLEIISCLYSSLFLFHACNLNMTLSTQGIAVALKCGATKAQFDSTVSSHNFLETKYYCQSHLSSAI